MMIGNPHLELRTTSRHHYKGVRGGVVRQSAISFSSGNLELEGVFGLPDDPAGKVPGVVLCHPHPLMGGNMDNFVVMSIYREIITRGMAALRFNFRGVGNSQGSHDKGEGEMEDVKAALGIFRDLPGVDGERVGLAGLFLRLWHDPQGRFRIRGQPSLRTDLATNPVLRRKFLSKGQTTQAGSMWRPRPCRTLERPELLRRVHGPTRRIPRHRRSRPFLGLPCCRSSRPCRRFLRSQFGLNGSDVIAGLK